MGDRSGQQARVEVERAAAARERHTLRAGVAVGVVFLLVVLLIPVVEVLARVAPDTDLETKIPLLVGAIAVWLLVTALLAAGLVWGFVRLRRRGWPTLARSPLWELADPVQRAALSRAIRRGERVPAGQEQPALRTARHIIAARRRLWLTPAAACVFLILWLVQDQPPWVIAGWGAAYLAAEITQRRWFAQVVAAVPRLEHLTGSGSGATTPRPTPQPRRGPASDPDADAR